MRIAEKIAKSVVEREVSREFANKRVNEVVRCFVLPSKRKMTRNKQTVQHNDIPMLNTGRRVSWQKEQHLLATDIPRPGVETE